MMRDMMGMPPEVMKEMMSNPHPDVSFETPRQTAVIPPAAQVSKDPHDLKNFTATREAMDQIEQELREAGTVEP